MYFVGSYLPVIADSSTKKKKYYIIKKLDSSCERKYYEITGGNMGKVVIETKKMTKLMDSFEGIGEFGLGVTNSKDVKNVRAAESSGGGGCCCCCCCCAGASDLEK